MSRNYKVSGLIYSSFNDVVKLIKSEYGWYLNYIKVYIRPMKDKQIELKDDVLSINPYFTKYLKDNNLEFDNLKKYFILNIAKELGKEIYKKFITKEILDDWNQFIDEYDNTEYESEEDKISTYFSILIYDKLKGRLDSYGKEQPVD